MKKIKATFIGTNGSLGYVAGREYSLILTQEPRLNGQITIRRVSGGGECDYDSTLAFIKNWTLIKTQNALDY